MIYCIVWCGAISIVVSMGILVKSELKYRGA